MYAQIGDITLKVIDLTQFERQTVWTEDGTDVESVDVKIGMTCTYAPGGNPMLVSAIGLSGDTDAHLFGTDSTARDVVRVPRGRDPGDAAGILPVPTLEDNSGARPPVDQKFHRSGPETDAELRLRLMLPRQKFILWAYARQTGQPIRWLESPRPGMKTDLGNGPKVLACDVVSTSGEPNSVVVHLQIQTEMSPCPTGSDRLVLSHRWEMTHSHDEDFYLTRTIDGRIRFNGAVIRQQGIRPDFVRAQFVHPVPLGYRRSVPKFTQSSDGLTIRYVVTDTNPTITFDPGNSGATRITIAERIRQSVERGFPGNGFGSGRDPREGGAIVIGTR